MKDREVFEAGKYKCPIPFEGIKKGDILFCQSPTTIWICIISHIEADKAYYYVNYNITANLMNQNDWFLTEYIKRKASESEIEMLYQYFQKNDVCWIESEKRLLNMSEFFLQPDNINFFKLKSSGQIGIATKDEKQVLFAGEFAHALYTNSSAFFELVHSYILVPCRFEDLKIGDIAFKTKYTPKDDTIADIDNVSNYVIIQKHGYVFNEKDGSVIKSHNKDFIWYKITRG